MGSVGGKFAQSVNAEQIVEQIAALARRLGANTVYGDIYQQFMLSAAFARRGLAYIALPWTNESKVLAVSRLRQWFRERSILIESAEEAKLLRLELLQFEERINPSGFTTFGARRGTHDDRVALLICAAMADTQGALKGSPLRKSSTRFVRYDGSSYHG